MASIRTVVHESLPFIEKELTDAETTAAQALITAELSSSSSPANDPSPLPALPPLREPTFTPAMQSELSRIASGEPLKAIDQSRYELQDSLPFPTTNTTNTTTTTSSISEILPALQKAYTTSTYLSHRAQNLHLLDAYGKNAWLTSNWQTESSVLAPLQADLAAANHELETLALSRRRAQDDVRDELLGLEDTWKRAVGRVLETEIATDVLRQQIRARQR
ncbi:Pre-mRNA-splicing factor SPF27 [Xylaria sp. CBS 124048]|nr:Pre-mRNA-splicing factor SPF27 [Xylaria sp. CBS 124048]